MAQGPAPAPQQGQWDQDGEVKPSPPGVHSAQGSSLHPTAASLLLPGLWPGASTERPGGACVNQDHAPAVDTEPSAAPGTGTGADT